VLYNSDLFKSDRGIALTLNIFINLLGPIAAFMYGSRLAVYIKKLEEIKVSVDISFINFSGS